MKLFLSEVYQTNQQLHYSVFYGALGVHAILTFGTFFNQHTMFEVLNTWTYVDVIMDC